MATGLFFSLTSWYNRSVNPHILAVGVGLLFITVRLRTLLLCAAAVLFVGAAARLLLPAARSVQGAAGREAPTYVLDAGHGGEDGGAVSADGMKESGVNLAVTLRLDALLRFLGRDTVLTRTSDVSVYSEGAETLRQKKASDLKNRVALVNATPDAVLVSIHQNSLPTSPRVHGAQVFHAASERSAALARSVQQALNEGVNTADKQEKPIDPSVYIMRNVTCPAILVECGFLSNADEAARLQQPEHQTALALAIAAGLLQTEETT